jgi:hypothetical protein
MPGKKATTHADFKKAALSLLEHNGNWKKVPASLKTAFSCQVFIDNPQWIVNDETHFIGAYPTKQAFDAYRKTWKEVRLSESAHSKFLISDWSLELVKVESEEVYTSYVDREVRLVINSIKPDPDSSLTPNSFVENLHRDNDIKLQISRLNLEEIREHTEVFDCGDLSRYEESKKTGVAKDACQDVSLDDSKETNVMHMKEILKKENPAGTL